MGAVGGWRGRRGDLLSLRPAGHWGGSIHVGSLRHMGAGPQEILQGTLEGEEEEAEGEN